MLKQQQEEAATCECTFHPVINHRSDRLMAERSEVLRVCSIPCHAAYHAMQYTMPSINGMQLDLVPYALF